MGGAALPGCRRVFRLAASRECRRRHGDTPSRDAAGLLARPRGEDAEITARPAGDCERVDLPNELHPFDAMSVGRNDETEKVAVRSRNGRARELPAEPDDDGAVRVLHRETIARVPVIAPSVEQFVLAADDGRQPLRRYVHAPETRGLSRGRRVLCGAAAGGRQRNRGDHGRQAQTPHRVTVRPRGVRRHTGAPDQKNSPSRLRFRPPHPTGLSTWDCSLTV